jgi:hypothetical protein
MATAVRGSARAARRRPGASAAHDAVAAPRVDRMTLVLGAAVVAASGTVYFLTAARDIVVGDSPEFVTVAVTLGVAHPPGYPLLTLLAHAFSLLPLEPLPFRVNLLSVVCGAGTVGAVYLTAHRLTGHALASAVCAIVLAFNPLFWAWSLVIEAFPLNNLLAAAMIYLLVVWNERPSRPAPLILAALTFGLGMANHQTIALLAPAVLFLLWRNRVALFERPWVIVACAGAMVVGLLPYAYLPWAAARQPAWSWGGISSMRDLVAHFLRESYGTGQLVTSPLMQGGPPLARIAALAVTFPPVEAALVLLGLVHAFRRIRWYFWFALLGLIATGPAFALYSNVNLGVSFILSVLERFFLLPHVVAAPLTALGVLLVTELVAQRLPRTRMAVAGAAAAACVTLVTLAQLTISYAAVDQSDNHVARRFAEDILDTLPPNSLLLVTGDAVVFPLLYVDAVERHRPDVRIVILALLRGEWYIRQVRERYPDVVIPFARYDGRPGVMRALVDANRGRPIGIQGPALDDSLKDGYWYYGYGLVQLIEPMAKDVELTTMVADNERLLGSYRTPSRAAIKPGTFERGILSDYALPAYRVAKEFEAGNLAAEARRWYERSLGIDPELPKALEALRRLAPR